MIAHHGLESAVPVSALTTKELFAWTATIRVVGAAKYFEQLALFEVP
jgi:hypothetical protein